MITAEELAKEIRKHHKFWPTMTDEAQARAIIDFIQSRAAGVQGEGNDAALIKELAESAKALGHWSTLRSTDQATIDYWTDRVADLSRRLATPQPPKDAGAVPPTREDIDAPYFNRMREADQAASAREAAVRADAVPLLNDSFAAFDEITGLCSNLRQGGPAPEDLESLSTALDSAIDIAAKMMIKISEPPAEPAARAQVAVGDGDGLAYGIIDPDYARIFTIARAIAWSEGYALAMHGSFTRDLDLIAIPWADRICEPAHLARRIADSAGLKDRSPKNPSTKPHGRLAWTLPLPGFGDPRWVDLSVVSNAHPSPAHAGAGDADAEYSRIYVEVIKVCGDQPMANEIARRLAGGKA